MVQTAYIYSAENPSMGTGKEQVQRTHELKNQKTEAFLSCVAAVVFNDREKHFLCVFAVVTC
jgi:hypothetical protein